MIRRYDLTRSDNSPYTGRNAFKCATRDGYLRINVGFPVSKVLISWTSIPTYEESSSSEDSSSEDSSSSYWEGPFNLPRLYLVSTDSTGFTVKYENIPEEIGYVEFSYIVF